MRMRSRLASLIIPMLLGVTLAWTPVAAQTNTSPFQLKASNLDLGLLEIGSILKLGDEDPRVIAVKLINMSLEFVGILLLILILWGGFQYMLSFGNEEKMKQARATIFNAIIGFILILSSWAIVRFVLDNVTQATADEISQALTRRFV